MDDLGNLGDFLGGIGVIISLVYLAFQIRRNTLSLQAATIQSASQASSEIMELMARDPDLLSLFHSGSHDFVALSQQDRIRFATLMGSMLYRFENLVAQTQSGLLPAQSWEGVANRLRGTFALPGTLEWWKRGRHVFTEQFQVWVDEELIGKESAAGGTG